MRDEVVCMAIYDHTSLCTSYDHVLSMTIPHHAAGGGGPVCPHLGHLRPLFCGSAGSLALLTVILKLFDCGVKTLATIDIVA